MIVSKLGAAYVPGTCNVEPYIEKVIDEASHLAPSVQKYEKLVADEETNCGACKMSAWGKRLLALPEVQGTTRFKQLLQLYQREMEQKCSGKPDTMTLALYGAGALVAFGVIVYLVKH